MIHLDTNKIIITTDFSETSLLAIKHGAFLAQYTKGEVFLVHIITKHWEKFNVFTPSIDPEIRRTFIAKCYPKTPEQEDIIRTY